MVCRHNYVWYHVEYMKNPNRPMYDLQCNIDKSQQCPAKVGIIREATVLALHQ